MKLNLIVVGSLTKEFEVLAKDYLNKINFFAKVNLIEIKEIKEEKIELKIQKETKLILEKIPKNSQVILCSLKGKSLSSEEFSQYFQIDNLTFVIGGSNGVDEKMFQEKIMFSKMTFPHQLFRVMLLEQIYRGFTILKNMKYHK